MFFSIKQISVILLCVVTVAPALAFAQSDNSDYIKNVIRKAREASAIQEFPAVQDKRPSESHNVNPPTSSTTTTTLPVVSTDKSLTGKIYDVRHGELPSNRQYWRFLSFYRSHAVVSLVVSGVDDRALTQALEELKRLQDRGVQIGEIVVSGGRYIADLNATEVTTDPPVTEDLSVEEAKIRKAARRKKVSHLTRLSQNLDLGIGEPIDVTPILARLGVKYSPTWVVRYHGRDYVYEGMENPSTLFSKDGLFRDGER